MAELRIKLKRQLFDIFQHCELHCSAECCEWRAFELLEHWLKRWCEFRDVATVDAALAEIADLISELTGRDLDTRVWIERFFDPTMESLTDHLRDIQRILKAYMKQSSIRGTNEYGPSSR
jgi:hypothetical protein